MTLIFCNSVGKAICVTSFHNVCYITPCPAGRRNTTC